MNELAGLPEGIGKYRLDAILGRGAMGIVYRAFDPLIERTLALKTVRASLGEPEQARELLQRFRTEAQAAGRLMHPNIVAVHEYGELDDLAYIAMEFVDGSPLSAFVGQAPCPLPQVLGWMSDLLAALAYAHAHGVIHRDIKPANLLVTRDGRIKVGDFGIARIESSTLTQTGAMLGTPSYMSPEQFRGETVDARSDLFSTGVVLYQMLTGQRPFAGTTAAVMQQVLTHMPPPPSHVNPALPVALDAVVMRALAKAPEARFAGAAAFRHALIAALGCQPVHHAADADADADAEADTDATVMLPRAQPMPVSPEEPSGSGLTADLTAWKLAALPQLEDMLTAQIGPVARLLLRRVVAAAPDFAALREGLLAHIPSPTARADFAASLDALEQRLAPRTVPVAGAAPDAHAHATPPIPIPIPIPADPAFGATLARLLAEDIGPIATIIVKRALVSTTDLPALLDLIALQIEAPDRRARFLDQARALLS